MWPHVSQNGHLSGLALGRIIPSMVRSKPKITDLLMRHDSCGCHIANFTESKPFKANKVNDKCRFFGISFIACNVNEILRPLAVEWCVHWPESSAILYNTHARYAEHTLVSQHQWCNFTDKLSKNNNNKKRDEERMRCCLNVRCVCFFFVFCSLSRCSRSLRLILRCMRSCLLKWDSTYRNVGRNVDIVVNKLSELKQMKWQNSRDIYYQLCARNPPPWHACVPSILRMAGYIVNVHLRAHVCMPLCPGLCLFLHFFVVVSFFKFLKLATVQ